MPRFARWLYDTVQNDLGDRILDAGAGIGTYTALMAENGRTVVALENEPPFVSEINQRFQDNPLVAVIEGDLGAAAGLPPFPSVDSVLCLNVLEHVEDDLNALSNLRDRVRPGGSLVALVPAYGWLYNRMDRALGHHRRYGRRDFIEKLTASRWTVERCFRLNVFAIPGWFVAGSILKREAPGGDLTRLYDRLVPAFSLFERTFIRGLAGISLVAVCKRID